MSEHTRVPGVVLLDPTSELSPTERPRRARPSSLTGLRVGLLDISKRRGDVFLDRVEERLHARGLEVRRYRKPRFSILAPGELKQQIRKECDLVIEALAD
jgi:hypothetical protein